MDEEKLKQLREKYAACDELPEDPDFRNAMQDATGNYSGVRTLMGAPFSPEMQDVDIGLIGVPFDRGVTRRPGARFGPKAMRGDETLIGPMNHETRINPFMLARIADIGDVACDGFDLNGGIETIEQHFHAVMDAGVVPLSVGGDHSVTYPIMKAVGREIPVGMVHIDAHCDTMGALADHKFHHGGPFRHAVLDGVLDPERCIQIGIRGAAEPFWEFSYESGMTVVHIEDVVELGIPGVIKKAREVIGDGPTYVTFDVDGLDPVFAPGTGTPEIGGLTTREAIQILRGLRGANLVGGDVVEIAPAYDPTSNTVQSGKQMYFEILCLLAESMSAG